MANILNAALDFMGFLDTEEEDYEIESSPKKNPKKVVSLLPKTSQQTIVVHVTPQAFDDVMDITKRLQDKNIVTINLALVDTSLSKRIIDFVSGAVYALDGGVIKLADNVYLLAGQGVTLHERDSSNFM